MNLHYIWKAFTEIKKGDIIKYPNIIKSFPHNIIYDKVKNLQDSDLMSNCHFKYKFEEEDAKKCLVNPITKEFLMKSYQEYDDKNYLANKLYKVMETNYLYNIDISRDNYTSVIISGDIHVDYMKLQEMDSDLKILNKKPLTIINHNYINFPPSSLTDLIIIPKDPRKEMYFAYSTDFKGFNVLKPNEFYTRK